jgi:hypothetical protein
VDAWSVDHVPDPRAAISSITRTLDEYPGGDPQQIAVIPPDHDAAGNIVYDGTYIYQYDAWSRLVQVNLAAQPPPGGGPAVGDAVPGTMQLAGPLVKHFTYDGLGRLVRVLSPYPEPGATPPEGWTVAPVRSERLYYDGVRRIQEVYTDPLLALGESAALGDPEAQGEVSQGGEEEGQTLEGEEGQIENGSGEPGGEEPPGPPPNTFITYLEREYLWGPGDGITSGAGAGLDELVAIFDIDRRAWWTLLDASGDVVAIIDDGAATTHGFGTGSASTSAARLCGQFCYDPYGSLLTVQGLHPYPDPRTGHKGLHLDRLDAGVADPMTGASIARHVDPSTLPGGGSSAGGGLTHRYFVRNRHYAPDLGRFMQRDPNATGAIALQASVTVGAIKSQSEAFLALVGHLRDGMGVYGAYAGMPLSHADPLGLFGFVEVLSTAASMATMFVPTPQDFLEAVARDVVAEYAERQLDDVEWALDWDQGDEWHSRGDDRWIAATIGRALYGAFEVSLGPIHFNWLDAFAAGASGAKGKVHRNKHLAGRYHPFVWEGKQVRFNWRGYPNFRPFAIKRVEIRQTGSYKGDAARADAKAGYGPNNPRPLGYTWHHEEDGIHMLLVPTPLHRKVGHTGGYQGS